MAKTVMQMVVDAQATVPGIGPKEARRRSQEDPNTLIVDVRDAADRRASGMVEGAIAVSSGTLPFVADTEVPEDWRDPGLQDRSRPVITVCDLGPMSGMAAKTLKDMGFQDVAYLEGGTQAWKDAGLPTGPPADVQTLQLISTERGEGMSTPNGYPRPELLAEPDWLWERRGDPHLRIIDCGDSAAYVRAHIPGAVRLVRAEDIVEVGSPQWLKDPDDSLHVLGAEGIATLAERLGISDDTTVVAYDDYNGSFATRLWWILTYYGHTDVKVLNGGWQRWLDEGRPATFRENVPEPGRFVPRPNEAMRMRLDELKARHADPYLRIVNVLWPEMYAGTANPFGNKRTGHIPGSVNIPIERFFADEDVPMMKPAPELRAVLGEAGLSPEQETIIHCQAGVRTTMGVFVTTLLGWEQVRAYEASMAEWANRDDTALTTG